MEQQNISLQSGPQSHNWAFGAAAVIAAGLLIWFLAVRSTPTPTAGLPEGGASLVAAASTTSVLVGQQFTVDIILNAGSFSPSAADLVVSYDATRLKAVSITSGGFLPTELAGGSVGNGRAAIAVASGTSPVTGSGVIARITFEAIAAGNATVVPTASTKVTAAGYAEDVVDRLVPVSVTIR